MMSNDALALEGGRCIDVKAREKKRRVNVGLKVWRRVMMVLIGKLCGSC